MCTVLIPTGWAHVYPAVHNACECMVNLLTLHRIVFANSTVCMKLSLLTETGAVAAVVAVAVFSSAGTMLIITGQLKQYTILKRVQKSTVLIGTAVFSDSDASR
jgi:hypothetical protein